MPKLTVPGLMDAATNRALVQLAIGDARRARDALKIAGAKKAAAYVRRAIKSAEGALRHADRIYGEALRLHQEETARLNEERRA